MLAVLDKFFLLFHTAFILFNLSGWAWKKTRLANLAMLTLTGASWFILGLFYWVGYCPLTDWHWRVLRAMGRDDLPSSYVKYLADAVTGLDFDPRLVDACVAAGYFLSLAVSIFVNVRDRRKNRLSRFESSTSL